MNDFVLRGFCEECNLSCQYIFEERKWSHSNSTYKYHNHDCKGIGFLSAKQLEIVFRSEEFGKWGTDYSNAYLWNFLEENPFLVSKILKQKEGN